MRRVNELESAMAVTEGNSAGWEIYMTERNMP
jgi:hypothetical protein